MPTIELLPAMTASDDPLVAELTQLVNTVYDVAEAGLWIDGATRTTTEEMRQMVAAEEIAVARVDDRVVGCVRIQQLDGAFVVYHKALNAPPAPTCP